MIGVPWRMTDGKWTVDRPDPIPIPPLPFEGARVQRERITKQDIDEFTIGCPGSIKDNKRAQAHSDRLRTTPHGAERLDRSNEVINEAEEVRRGKQRKKISDSATAAVPETESAAPESREDAIEPEVNPKRLLMKSASSTANGSGQRKEKRSIPDDEARMQVEDTP